MLLTSVVQDMEFNKIKGNMEMDITGIAYDSREVVEGSLFVAISGFSVDGHRFINKAIEQGAAAIILEKEIEITEGIAVLQVPNSRNALARISANFYNNPTDQLNVIGLTGTNGKTSTTYFIKSIFEQANQSVGSIGTIGTMINNKLIQNKNTTPESLNLQQFFTKMNDTKVDSCIMEVSSHALNLDRVAYSKFNIGIFTNLSPDHLELHKNMEEYFFAKAKLFELTSDFNVINVDDEYGQKLINIVKVRQAKLITYGIENSADIFPTDIEYTFEGTTYTVNTPAGSIRMKVNLPGAIYVYNSLAAIACAYCNDIPLSVIQKGIQEVGGIDGRMEVVYRQKDYKIMVDFSHTEDALEKALTTIKPYVKGRIILVFGVYADTSESGRDKRYGMARVASEYADLSIVTSDNPKQHDPNVIIEEIAGAMDEHQGDYKTFLDRKEAIEYAVEVSNENDTIFIAGKGHERTQIIGDQEIPFNESEIIFEALKSKKYFVKSK
ncbi:UDP-N-acetylmuramoyl-L-alanyl-D-glutamate--2,6-diaminopimelate ligase [Virgibacillus profundi]|uniref:UDP-N-acetylmuramyl-tripeptide synthetase n=1 Tax=Virgibacillus profundi TaxID=2024555 RepID=A0A2A2IJS5_9BACI|nr:UDP-N-acetylmuramoyl-L-alanyl-D-glutamate--2,6-diaminopimelate ligase [Virgibacillus profundi]PAV31514.1 UDP-N-acetylmuramoyl-L-alanyl-D-glutamate--2,6-diaminopimelate ligase [Virgibacillus profundi]PXY55700.1 UDP-N-acetylmuramoyl-L-alanyl-D-glutamate--2,6-diaminopimelate ligase [Virgibacillus profundi]